MCLTSFVLQGEGAELHDDLEVAHLGPDLLYHPVLDPEDEDTRFEDALIS
jgi:hypothetical protein